MTREELKVHCEGEIQQFERVEKIIPVTRGDRKRYEEHKLILELLEQLSKLQNRCFALTQGQICMFCPYDCENRTTEHRSEEES